jgi:hypothetical protein
VRGICLAFLLMLPLGAWTQTVDSSASTGVTFATGTSSPTTERVRITTTGNVGISTTTPTQKLEVRGSVSATTVYSASLLKGMPIGVILPWHKNMTGVGALPEGWLECNGQTISDADSPMNGQAVPDLNNQVYAGGRGYYIRGGSTSGNVNASTYLGGNANKYNFSYSGSNYYGVNYGRVADSENGSTNNYNASSNNLGLGYFQVAAMTVVHIMKVK